jgi:hypothetical protein
MYIIKCFFSKIISQKNIAAVLLISRRPAGVAQLIEHSNPQLCNPDGKGSNPGNRRTLERWARWKVWA